MKVKELRSWLQDFGEKNTAHYHRSHDMMIKGPMKKSFTTSSMKDERGMLGIIPQDDTLSHKQQQSQLDSMDDVTKDDYIEMKPSAASTSPSSSFEDDFYYDDRQTIRMEFQEPMVAVGNMGVNHLKLLRSHGTPVLTVDGIDEKQCDKDQNQTAKSQAAGIGGSFHTVNLLDGQILTKASLDFICQDGEPTANISKIPSCNFDLDSLEYSHDGDTESVKYSDCVSVDSETPSIYAGALVSKMAAIFLKDESFGNDQDGGYKSGGKVYEGETSTSKVHLGIVTRKMTRPEDLPFLKASPLPEKKPVIVEPPLRNTTVGRGIRKFGNRKSIVERRKEQLSKQLSEPKPAIYSRKVKWDIAESGGYKKQIVTEKRYY